MPAPASFFANRYRLIETLGRGGMGEVWRAQDERLNRQCAIKVLRQMQDGATVERFSREARTLASLRHPGVVTVYDYGVDADRPYLVMELLPGPSLAELLRAQGPLPFESVRLYGSQAAAALQAVHDAGVVHRDIKPANLVVDAGGAIRLVDFGIALGSSLDHTLTEHGAIIGSAAYLAPEQAIGGRADARSDLYGFGCLLMTLLTGKPPFDDDSPVEILGRHLNDAPARPSDRRPDTPADIDQLVIDLLAKEPGNRPASAAEVAARLAGGTAPRRGPGPVPMPPRAGVPAAAGYAAARYPTHEGAGGPTATMSTRSQPAHRNGEGGGARPWLIAVGVLFLLGAGGAAWALSQSDDGAGTQIPFVPERTPSATPSAPPAQAPTVTATPPATFSPPLPPPTPLAPPPGRTPTPTTKPPIITIPPVFTPAPKPVPTAELNALAAAVENATIADAAVQDDLRARVLAIRADAEANRRSAALALTNDFIAKVGELEGSEAPANLDPETAANLRAAAQNLKAKLSD